MNERFLRKMHRNIGAVMALFFVLQALTGLVLTYVHIPDKKQWVEEEGKSASDSAHTMHEEGLGLDFLEVLHKEGGSIGVVYRTVTGVCLIAMAFSGLTIFYKVRSRTRRG